MPTCLTTLIVLCILAMPAVPLAQETAGEVADTAAAGEPSAEPVIDTDDDGGEEAEDEAEIDDSDLDEQSYEEDDDDFVPTEEIPADEPIPFPSNI
jgi:hypothetical protein